MAAREISNKMKVPEAIVLPDGWVLIEAVKKATKILAADENNPHNIDYLKIVRVAQDVKIYKEGDIVLDFDGFQKADYEWRDRLFRKIHSNNLLLVTNGDNFNPEYKEIIKPNLLIN
jgi:hypothetical protein